MFYMLQSLSVALFDLPIGRIDYHMLSDQALMEMLFHEIMPDSRARAGISEEDGSFHDVCEMDCTVCDTCGHVKAVNYISRHYAYGTVHFAFIPPTVTTFTVGWNKLEGTIVTAELPDALEKFSAQHNLFSGEVDFTCLPRNILFIDLFHNNFSGSCVLTKLPKRIEYIDVHWNRFIGSVELHALPASLRILWLADNDFFGEICLNQLPEDFDLNISGNAFCGRFQMNSKKQNLMINASFNQFYGDATIPRSMSVPLVGNSIDRVIDECGLSHPNAAQMCYDQADRGRYFRAECRKDEEVAADLVESTRIRFSKL